jgi:hypothetical protein
MAEAPTAQPGPDAPLERLLTELRGLQSARDDQVMKIVGLIDALPRRGALDKLLDPLRPRLARLHPPRPLTFPRLLFRPLDPLIVDDAAWREGEGTLPRGLLLPLAREVEKGLDPDQFAALEGEIRRHSFAETTLVEKLSARLSALAGPVLTALTAPPSGPYPAGMSGEMALALAHLAGRLLTERPALETVVRGLRAGGGDEAARVLLRGALYRGPLDFLATMRLLSAATGSCSQIFAILGSLASTSETAREQRETVGGFLQGQVARVKTFLNEAAGMAGEAAGVTRLAARVRELGTMLRGLELCAQKGGTFPALSERGADPATLTQKLDDLCHSLVSEGLRTRVLERPVTGAPGETAEREADLAALLELMDAGRLIAKSGADYDFFLREARSAVEKGVGEMGKLDPVARARLLEYLAGAEAAYAFYKAQKRAGNARR